MLIASFPAGPFQTNCYVVAADAGRECVIIDPGMTAAATVRQVVTEQKLTPVAVLCTHGHIDHVASVGELCATYDMPAYIHPEDRPMLSQPFASLDRLGMVDYMRQLSGGADALSEPADVRELTGGFTVAGLDFTCHHAPGHTPGSTLLETPYDQVEAIDRLVFTGDVLFQGSIGRTDLPGGDHSTMQTSLREVVLELPDEAAVLPGHGGQTTIGRERATNPYLQDINN